MKSLTEVEKYDYSRRIQRGTAIDLFNNQILVNAESGKKHLCFISRNLNKNRIYDNLPCYVLFKKTYNDYVITAWETVPKENQNGLDLWR